MGEFLNHNSFLLTIAVLWIAAAVTLLRRNRSWRSWLWLGGITAVLAGVYFSFQPAAATNGDADTLRAQIGAGQPVLLELQSQN